MKRLLSIAVCLGVLGGAGVWATVAIEQARKPDLAAMLPDGALLYLEARDFGSLLKDWNGSDAMKTWLTSDNRAVFSQSRLFTRLSQAQDEFAAAAGVPTDTSLLAQVAGKESCLGLYDIGNLEFVYVTRLEQRDLENTPLWQTRSKFEQRTEGGAQFYARRDPRSNRTAAFAQQDGWLIVGTREDLVAGVLDRLQGAKARSVTDEAWYADSVKQAGPQGDLRMVLNLEKIVASPYFRAYWIQSNVAEMKQFSGAAIDLNRTPENFREERVLVRREGLPAVATGDVRALAAMVPDDAAFYSAQASPDPRDVLQTLRDNLLEMKPQAVEREEDAPPAVAAVAAGSASDLEVQIDQAPAVVPQADAYQPLRALLTAGQPEGMLQVYATPQPQDGVFAPVATAIVVSSAQPWNEGAVLDSLTTALLPGLTAGKLGAGWAKRQAAQGDYMALDGAAALYVAVSGKQLLLSNDSAMMGQLLSREHAVHPPSAGDGVTYAAVFQHARERASFRALTARLDMAGHRGASNVQASPDAQPTADGQTGPGVTPAFFSGNVASLSGVFSKVAVETVEEKDQGAKVTQTVTYQWGR